jgi:hypothetical protein
VAKYKITFPEGFEANTVSEIVTKTGWSRETVYRIMGGNSRIPASISVNEDFRQPKNFQKLSRYEQELHSLSAALRLLKTCDGLGVAKNSVQNRIDELKTMVSKDSSVLLGLPTGAKQT